jgi:hypothetical protein
MRVVGRGEKRKRRLPKTRERERDEEREIRLICMNEWRNVGVYVKRFSFIII